MSESKIRIDLEDRLLKHHPFYCSYCGEKITGSDNVYLIQRLTGSHTELRHEECMEDNLKKESI